MPTDHVPTPMQPMPHQDEAIERTQRLLESHRRARIVMCCGSGKTLVELRTAQPYRHVLVLEPSLALIHQVLGHARRDGLCDGRSVLCVCSDASVAEHDDWQVGPDELGVPVTTDPAELRAALERQARPTLVLCTYQSQGLLRAALPRDFQFDLIVCDEAHRTAGATDRSFSMVLDDTLIPARRRLFATATPRVFAPPVKEGEDAPEPQRCFSMDDEEVYGPLAYELPIPQAIRHGIVCDYQVLVACVTEASVQESLTSYQSHFLLPDSQAPLELVAGQLAIVRALEQTGARRIISFHRTIDEAKDFATDPAGLLVAAGLTAFHIAGSMPTKRRQDITAAFLACDGPAMLTNARCLTEGVDIPQVDMIAFMSRRESTTDIAQALGRALRRFPGKARGYVLLPLYMDADVPPEVALERSDLAVTWEVLHSLLESDDALAEGVWAFAHNLFNEASTSTRREAKLRVIASSELQDALERAISVRAIERIARRWDEMYLAAREFHAREGHLLVPLAHTELDLPLGAWIEQQRLLRRRARLTTERVRRLEAIGMAWTESDRKWLENLVALGRFKVRQGHLRLPDTSEYSALKRWVLATRSRKAAGKLRPSRIASLEALEFPWSEKEARWQHYTSQLRDFRLANPSAAIPSTGPLAPLSEYLSYCRKLYRNGELSEERANLLRRLGVTLRAELVGTQPVRKKPPEESWTAYYETLKDFLERNEDKFDALSKTHVENGLRLWPWLQYQRHLNRKGLLSPERFRLLTDLGVSWNPTDDAWDAMFNALVAFRERHRHQIVEVEHGTRRLNQWIAYQQRASRLGRLAAERHDKLTKIGFAWSQADERWEFFTQQLRSLKTANAEARPARTGDTGALYYYLVGLSRLHRAGLLPDEKLRVLRELQVEWAMRSSADAAMLAHIHVLTQRFGKNELFPEVAKNKLLAAWVRGKLNEAATDSTDPIVRKLRRLGLERPASGKTERHRAALLRAAR